jgi:hypothetical protein
MAALMAAG